MSAVISCNSEENEPIYTSYSNTMVRSFSLAADIHVLPNLAYRYFTIDLVGGEIFNPDSLPYGTDISALVPVIKFSSPSSVEITVADKSDGSVLKTIDYLKNEKDSIDFNNDVRMRVVAADGVTTQNYRIEVRVHRVQADSLLWTSLGRRSLPTALPAPTAQKTVQFKGRIYCFTADAQTYNVAVAEAPASEWSIETFSPAGGAMTLSSVTASADTLFALCGSADDAGNMQLAASTDGVAWTLLPDALFSSLVGMWNNTLTGVVNIDGAYLHASYGEGAYAVGDAVDAAFPVSGYSSTVAYADTLYGASQIYFFGGRLADGTYSSRIWAYDGDRWAAITDVGYSGGAGAAVSPREGAMFFSYFQDDYDAATDLFFRKVYYYIVGGRDDTQVYNDLYYTNTIGGYWERAAQGSPLSLSDKWFEPRAFASVCICEESGDEPMASAWQQYSAPDYIRALRSSGEPVPYIYLFGGYDSRKSLIEDVYRGVIRRFTFRP